MVLLLLLACLPTAGADPAEESNALPLVTDRPDFTESSAVAPPGHVQMEMGVEFGNDDQGQSLSLPLLLLRYGMSDALELRLGVPSLISVWPSGGAQVSDVGSLELGAKVVFDLGAGFALGVLPFAALPITEENADTVGVDLGGKIVWAVDVLDGFSLGGNLGLIVSGVGCSASEQEYLASLSAGFALDDGWGLFVESWLSALHGDFEHPRWIADTGFTCRLIPTVQLDGYVGVNLLALPEDAYLGTGVSVLW
jgi:hypothetical protein